MDMPPIGATMVVFVSQRNEQDEAGYAAAAAAMDALAALQPGYIGVQSVRGQGGMGITVSYWADEASAIAWRKHADHAAVRAKGHATWYDHHAIIVGTVGRCYDWVRDPA